MKYRLKQYMKGDMKRDNNYTAIKQVAESVQIWQVKEDLRLNS